MLSAALMLPLVALAASETGDETTSRHRLDRLSNELQLSVDQKAKLEAIFNEKHEKFRAIREESNNLIKEVLSAEQMSKFDAMRKLRYEKRRKMIEANPETNP